MGTQLSTSVLKCMMCKFTQANDARSRMETRF